MKVDLLHGLDLAGLDETSKLGDWLPLLLLVLVGATASTATSTSSITTATVSSAICFKYTISNSSCISAIFVPKLTTAGCESSSCCVGHIDRVWGSKDLSTW